jgi:choline dehydrogenase-like flavoprotein
VAVLDRVTRREYEVSGRVVLLAASTLESTRILLNSRTSAHPDGIGNSSGLLGTHLMDHAMGVCVIGERALEAPAMALRGSSFYLPRFRNVAAQDSPFLRGYGVQGDVAVLPDRGVTELQMYAFGEMLPDPANRIFLDPSTTDAWDVPILNIECSHGSNDEAMAADASRELVSMAEEAGYRVTSCQRTNRPPGIAIHEAGTARMGRSPARSVLNPFNQCWDVENLVVVDGAAFPSVGTQNPVLTLLAMTARACDGILERMKRLEL